MKYFKLLRGFDQDDNISIDETELEKAIYAQITGQVGVFKNGTIAGNYISSIVPDYQRAMGFNPGYKIKGEDWKYIERDCKGYSERIEEASKRVKQIVATGQTHLLDNTNNAKQLTN